MLRIEKENEKIAIKIAQSGSILSHEQLEKNFREHAERSERMRKRMDNRTFCVTKNSRKNGCSTMDYCNHYVIPEDK